MSVPYALLALLTEGPKYGLRLQSEFESRTGEVWPLNVGQVYTTLQRLERDGLVESDGEGEGPQKGYHITAAGRHELNDWLRTPSDTAPPRDELVIKVLVAVRLPGVDVHGLVQAMQRYTRLKADAADDDFTLGLVADAELFRLEGTVRWLDAADARLRRLAGAAPANSEAATEPAGQGPGGGGAGWGRSWGRAAPAGARCYRSGARSRTRPPVTCSSPAPTCRPCRATTGPGCAGELSAMCSRTSTSWPGSRRPRTWPCRSSSTAQASGRRGRSPWRRSTSWMSPSVPTATPMTSRAVSANGWRSPGPS